MANNYFTATGKPNTRGPGSSSEIRAQLGTIQNAFDRLPNPLTGTAKGFQGGTFEAPIINNAQVFGGTLGSFSVPAVSFTSNLYFGVDAGTAVASLALNNVAAAAFHRIPTTSRTAFSKMVGSTNTCVFAVDEYASVIMGDQTTEKATTTTTGFFYLPTVAGTPTGAPTAYTGAVPFVYDRTNNRLYARNGGTWRSVLLS